MTRMFLLGWRCGAELTIIIIKMLGIGTKAMGL